MAKTRRVSGSRRKGTRKYRGGELTNKNKIAEYNKRVFEELATYTLEEQADLLRKLPELIKIIRDQIYDQVPDMERVDCSKEVIINIYNPGEYQNTIDFFIAGLKIKTNIETKTTLNQARKSLLHFGTALKKTFTSAIPKTGTENLERIFLKLKKQTDDDIATLTFPACRAAALYIALDYYDKTTKHAIQTLK